MKENVATVVIYAIMLTGIVSFATSEPRKPNQPTPYLVQPEDVDRFETLVTMGDEIYHTIYDENENTPR